LRPESVFHLPMTPLRSSVWLLIPALLVAPSALTAQDGLAVGLETGFINFGPIVSEEVTHFVRFGSNDGMERYFAATIAEDRWYARLLVAPTQVHVWSVADTIHPVVDRRADPGRSRFHYRPLGRARDSFVWSSVSGGARGDRGPASWRLGGGLISLSQTDHGYWGASVGHVPKLEATGMLRWRAVGLACTGTLGFLGPAGGRWTVLEHASGANPSRGRGSYRFLTPLSCGAEIRMGAGG